MPYRLELPDGSFVTVQDDAKPQAVALKEAKDKFPDAFPQPPGIGQQLLGAPKELLKGAASGIVQAVGGLGALPYTAARYIEPELKPFAETGFGKAITGAEQYLAPSDEGVVTQLAGGLGSLGSMLGPQVLLRGVGGAGRLAAGIAPRAAAPVAVGQTAGLGAEEARQRVEIARGEGINVTPGEELAALSVGVPIGLTELLPVEKLFKGLHAGMDEGFKFGVANVLKRALAQGGIEGAQEAASGLLQDLSAKGLYNPNLNVGESMLGEFGLGAGVGAIAQTGLDVLLRKDISRAYNTRLQRENQRRLKEETDRLRAEEQNQIDMTKKNLGITDNTTLALPAPAAQVEPVVETDPLMNPVGFFNSGELTPEYLKAVNNIRDKEGKAKIDQFSIEDLVDAGAPKAEIDRLLAFKTGFDGKTELEAQDVINVAQQKNVDVTTPGFADFLRRSTGEADLSKMSQPQLFSAFKALDQIAPSETLQILPQGTNATRFTQQQYDKSLKNIKALFPESNILGRSSVVQEIKDYSGLESDRDAESLLQTAINRGDLTTVSKPRFDVVDQSGKVVRSYLTRDSAERAAAKEGLSVREGTSINVAIPGEASSLPGGPDIRKGTFQEGTAPASFEVRGPDAVLTTAKTQEEADIKANRLAAMREQKANGFLGQVAKIEEEMAKSQRKLESMEADGKADTLEYKKLAAQIANNNKNLENQANRLRKKAQDYTQPLTVAPKGEKPVTREGYTLFQEGQPVATFPSQQAAEEAALANLTDDQIQGIIDTAPTLRGLMPQRLRKMAIDEQTRRRQATEVDATYGPRTRGIEVAFKGDREAAADRLRAAGVQVSFTPEVQAQIDELSKKLRPIMDKLGLGELRLNIVKAIKTPMGSADGSYVARLITIAMDAANPIRTLRHEGIHALKELGAFTPEQWRVLENKAKSEWLQKYNIPQRYKGLSQEEQLEEAISDAFSDFDQTKVPAGLIGSLFRKIKQFMEAFGNGFRGLGFQSSEGIFANVEAGKMQPDPRILNFEPLSTSNPKEKYSVLKASPEVLEEANRYYEENGIRPYTEQTITSIDIEPQKEKFSLKQVGKYGNHDVLGIPVNKNGTVTLYFPTSNDSAREVMRSRKLVPTEGSDRIYLTNESSAKIVLGEPGNITQQVGGANVLVQIDPGMLQIDQQYDNGRIDFFIPVKEGKAFFDKMKMTRLFTIEGARNKGFDTDRTLNQVGDSLSASVAAYMSADRNGKRELVKQAREVLKREHNIGTLLGENGKLEKTRVGEYGLTYEGKGVASLGLGLASAQRLNTQERVTTCPKSAICEGLCLGETSGQNELYGGEAEFRQGPRLSQYLKTEALMMNPDAFGVVLAHEIQSFEDKTSGLDYQPAIRLNVTSDIPPKVYKGIIDAFPNVMFYDYTKLYGNDVIAPNHHLTYSSSGASQVVNGETVVNKLSTWDKDVKKLLEGKNVAMAFTSRKGMPKFVVDEKTGNKFEVWNGDNYDARFLDPVREDGIGYIVGLTNKDRTTKPEEAAKKYDGFFLDYDPQRDGDTLVVKDQSKLNQTTPTEEPVSFVKIGNQKYSLRQTDTPEFKQWFGKSTISTLRGEPKIMYHGTARDISEFRPKQANAIFVTDDPDFAENFSDTSEDYMVNFFIAENKIPRDHELLFKIEDQAIENALKDGAITQSGAKKIRKLPFFEWEKTEIGDYVRNAIKDNLPTRANIMPLFVRAEAPFDYQNAEDVQGVIDYIEQYKTPEEIYEAFNRDLDVVEDLRAEIEAGKWMTIENPVVQEAIKFNRHDGFYVREGGVKNLAVYEPSQIKSAIGNIGTFARDNNDIRYSLALDGLQPQSRLIPNEGGNPDGNLGIAPSILESKPIRMLIGTHDDINDKGYGAKHILNRIMSDPRRTPVGTEEMLERVVKEAQRTAQSYTRIYQDKGRFVLFNGRNSLVVSPEKDSMSIITMYKQTAPDNRYGNPVWQGRAPSVAEFLAPVRGMEVEAEGADIIPKPAAVARKRNVYTPGSIADLAAEVRTTKPGKISLKKYPEKFSLAIPKESVRDFFDVAGELPTSESVDIIRSNWIGGVSGIGERNLAYDLPDVEGGQEYTDLVQQTVRENLGESFKGYRLMSKDEFEELQDGSMGTQLASITLDPDFALAFAKIPRYAKIPKGDLVVAEMDITPEHVQMIGSPNESELVIDYGVGYNPDEVVGYASPVSTAQPKFSIREQMDADMVDAIDRTTSRREEKGFIGRIIDAISPGSFAKFRQGFINKYEAIERQTGQVAKEFGSNELMADTSAIAAALFSDRAAGVAAASFGAMDRVGGIPVYKNGFTSISTENDTVKGLIPILEPLAKYNDPFIFQAFQFYAGTRRGKRLTAEGREKLFTPEDIKRGQLLEQQYPEFKQVFDEYQKYNEGLVKFMKDTGVISDKEAQIWMQNSDYIPFYRQMEGEKTVGPNVFSPIAGVAKPKKLKGSEAQLADFMETVVRNSRAAIEASMKNVAAQRVIRDMLRLNQGELVPPTSSGADIVTVKENGLTKHYRVEDPMLVESLKGLNLPQLPFLEVLAAPSNILRNLVTKDPGFMLANLMRDSLQAWTTTGTNIKPIADTFKQYGRVLAGASPEAIALGRAGLFGGYDFAGDVNATASKVEEQLRKNVGAPRSTLQTVALPITKMWELLDKGSHASDLATRAEVYKRTLEETGNEAEAAYQAMEVLNFSRKGNSALIRVVTALVPFMNARIQGLDVLYRAGWGKMASRTAERQQKAFITRSLTILALSSMYWMLASDTEEYKTAEAEARDNNWIVGSVRIPIPFEIGTVFKVFPERILEYFFGNDTGKDLQKSIARNITSTLAFNPIPQAFLPAVENIANYSFFTGQPIVGRGMEDVAKPFQAYTGTSLLAQEVGAATGQSPIMIDNLIRGYTGTLGTYAVMALDAVMRGEGDPTKATMKAEQLPIIKRFFASEQGTGTISSYFELKKQVDESVRTINFLERTGRMEDLREYMQDKGAKLYAIKPYVRQLDKDMTRLRELRAAVQNSKIDSDQKRDVLENIRKSEVALTSRIQYLKKALD